MSMRWVWMAILGMSATGMAAEGIRLAEPGLSYFNLSKEQGDFYADHLAQQLTIAGVRVTTASEITSLIGLERQKQLLGCSEAASSCIAELANALGVDALVTGSIGRFGKNFQINLKVLSTRDARPLTVYSSRVAGDEGVLDELTKAAKSLSADLFRVLRAPSAGAPSAAVTPVSEVSASSSGAARSKAWIPAAAGGALLVGGGVCLGLASGIAQRLQSPTPGISSSGELHGLASQGSTFQTAGFALGGAGVAALAVAGSMYLFGGGEGAVAVVPGPGGGALVFTGVFR